MNRNILIIGAGGHGRVVKETALAMGCFDHVDFLDDHSNLAIGKWKDYKCYTSSYTYAFVAIGNNDQRREWMLQLTEAGYQIPVLIHPIAYTSPLAKIECGSIVCANAVINTHVTIEKGCIISIGALIDHDSFIGEYTHINLGAIVKAGCKVEPFGKLDAGMIHSNVKKLEGYI